MKTALFLEPLFYQLHSYSAPFLAGGHSNWHSHPGLEIGSTPTTNAGPLTIYRLKNDGSCSVQQLGPGQSYIFLAGEVHMAINRTGSTLGLAVIRIHPSDNPVVTVNEAQPASAGGCLDLLDPSIM